MNLTTKESGTIKHYQLNGWPDGDRPAENILEEVLSLVKANVQCLSQDKMTVVHCSAGVGRTGTFIAATELYMQIQEKKPISIFETVRRLREQRWGMVYTQPQYEYLYDFVKSLIEVDSDDSI